ncbi:MAG: hypothetical protein H7067_19375 [Burkholderiales bacterium]|nr:hypothetical protein [Opitutaceae bacterium]
MILLLVFIVVLLFAENHLFRPNPGASAWPLRFLLAVAIVTGPTWLLLTVVRGRPFRWPAGTAFAASLALFVAWLSTDDPQARHPTRPEVLRSNFPDAAFTHALVLRYAKNGPDAAYPAYESQIFALKLTPSKPDTDAAWRELVATHHAEIEAAWTKLAPQHLWFAEMAAQPALADLTLTLHDPTPYFSALRDYSRVACARATWLASQGQPEAAADLLLPVLSVAEKLEIHSRTIVRRMIAISLQRQALATLRILLDVGQIPPSLHPRLHAALTTHRDPAEGARHLFLCEYDLMADALIASVDTNRFTLQDATSPGFFDLSRTPRVLYNRNATLTLFADAYERLGDAAAKRDLARLSATEDSENSGRHLFRKNPSGHLLLRMAIPAFSKITASYWEAHDWRTALLLRVQST